MILFHLLLLHHCCFVLLLRHVVLLVVVLWGIWHDMSIRRWVYLDIGVGVREAVLGRRDSLAFVAIIELHTLQATDS